MILLIIFGCPSLNTKADLKVNVNKCLTFTVTSSETWQWVRIRNDKPMVIDHVPENFGMYFTPDYDFSLKPHIVFKDSEGEIFRWVYQTGFSRVPDQGGYVETKIENLECLNKKNVSGSNGRLDAPIEILGLDIANRNPVFGKIISIDRITVDNKIVEDFETDRVWYLDSSDGAEEVIVNIVEAHFPKEIIAPADFPWEISDNFVTNSDFEEDTNNDGLPDGWQPIKNKEFLKDFGRKTLLSPLNLNGKHKWQLNGLGSKRSLWFSSEKGKFAGWCTTINNIRPNTTYALSLWYKQPRRNSLHIFAFGKVTTLRDMFEEQPEHWVRMSILLYSGSFSGSQNLIILGEGPGEFWIDCVELYEGTSGIGYNTARMELYYYYDVEISPDMISPVSFGYEHLFKKDQAPEYLEFVLDLPSKVEMTGFTVAIPWSDCTDKCTLKKETTKHNGNIYDRYIIRMPFSARGGYKPFTFPVGHHVDELIRDEWTQWWGEWNALGKYSGLTSLKYFLKTKEKDGNIFGYYFVRWPEGGERPSGQQKTKSIRMNIVRIPHISAPKRFIIMPNVNGQEFKVRPDWTKDFRRIGVTRLSGGVPDDVSLASKLSNDAANAGFEGFSPWDWLTMDYHKYPEAHGVGMHGEKLESWCLSYRGGGFTDFVKKCKRYVDRGVYRINLNDEVSWECFCQMCREKFRNLFTKIYPNERYVDPIQFEGLPDDYPKHHRLWKDYFGGMYGEAIADVKKEVEVYMKAKGINKEFRFSASSVGLFTSQIKMPVAIEPAFNIIEEELIQPYIYHYFNAYKGNPKRVGDVIANTVDASKDIPIKVVPLLSPGLGTLNPSSQLDPRSQMKYQILEGALAGMEGYGVYSANDIDLGDLRQMALANRLIVKYEDIIMDGESAKDIAFVSLPPGLEMMRSLRARRLGEQTLIYVADYTTYQPISTILKIRVPVEKHMMVVDAEDETSVAELSPDKDIFEVEVKEERGRLLLVKPHE